MRILHTESSLNLGGQELRTLYEMEALKRRGHFSLLAARPGSKIFQEAKERGLEASLVEMRGSIDPQAVLRLVWIIRKKGMDLVCTHGSKDGWSAGVAARLLGKKVVRSRNVAIPIRSHYFGRIVYTSLCDRIITTSNFIKKGMVARGIPSGKMTCIPTGVDEQQFHPHLEKGAFRAELGLDAGRPLVGMVSMLRGDNGPDTFIEAARILLAASLAASFVLVGDGWMRQILERMVLESPNTGSIILAGYQRDIPRVMADLDLLALPARIDGGIPQAILQAHAMALPVVASDVGGMNEVAMNGETALCVSPNNPQALAVAIREVLSDRKGAEARANKAREMVLKNFTQERMMNRLLEVYSSLLDESNRRRSS